MMVHFAIHRRNFVRMKREAFYDLVKGRTVQIVEGSAYQKFQFCSTKRTLRNRRLHSFN
jgi:hypothetical protein